MKDYVLENEKIRIRVSSKGGELKSLKTKDKKSYLWNSDPKYWGYSSPVLFPFVGRMRDNTYTYNGKEYNVLQHGFARTSEFELHDSTDKTVSFIFTENEETLERYPFKFNLICGYKIEDNKVIVSWTVKNTNDCDMPFFIGAHPAFMCPSRENSTGCFLKFDGVDEISCRDFRPSGYVDETFTVRKLNEGTLEINDDLLGGNTLVLENSQVKSISLLTPEKVPYIKVDFDAPVVGIWSKENSNNTFVCIEPWYGRCDSAMADREITNKQWVNILKPGEKFKNSYTIEVF